MTQFVMNKWENAILFKYSYIIHNLISGGKWKQGTSNNHAISQNLRKHLKNMTYYQKLVYKTYLQVE